MATEAMATLSSCSTYHGRRQNAQVGFVSSDGRSLPPTAAQNALEELLLLEDAAVLLLPLLEDTACTPAGQAYAFSGLMATESAEAVLALKETAAAPHDEARGLSRLRRHFDLYALARDLPVAALMAANGASDRECQDSMKDAGITRVADLVRYCQGDVGVDGAENGQVGTNPPEEAVFSLYVELGMSVSQAEVRSLLAEALGLVERTRRLAGSPQR